MNTRWKTLRNWLRRVSVFMEQQNEAVKPNPYAWGIFRPAERESDELARLSAEHPGLGTELTRVLSHANQSFEAWAAKPDDAGWIGVMNGLYELEGQLRRTVEALDGPLDSPPPAIMNGLTKRSRQILEYLWHHSGEHFRELCHALDFNDESSARRAVDRLINSLLELGEPDLVRVQNARVWVENRDT